MRIVWARDPGERNALLVRRFPGRKLWRLHVAPAEMALQPLTINVRPAGE